MKKRRDKKYVPKPALPGGGLHALVRLQIRHEDNSPLTKEQLGDLGLAYHLSLDGLLYGEADEENWSCVVCSINIATALAEMGIGENCEDDFVRALDGLFRAKIRSKRTGSFRLDGDAIQDVKAALALHDQQMQVATKYAVMEALRTVQLRVKEGNVYTMEAVA